MSTYRAVIGPDKTMDDLVTQITGIRLVAALASKSDFEATFTNQGAEDEAYDEVLDRLA